MYCLYRLKTNYIQLNNLTLKKTIPKQNTFHGWLFISKRSFICCSSFINFVVDIITVATHAKNLRSSKILVTFSVNKYKQILNATNTIYKNRRFVFINRWGTFSYLVIEIYWLSNLVKQYAVMPSMYIYILFFQLKLSWRSSRGQGLGHEHSSILDWAVDVSVRKSSFFDFA